MARVFSPHPGSAAASLPSVDIGGVSFHFYDGLSARARSVGGEAKMSVRMLLLTFVTLVWTAGSSAYADCQTTVFDRSGAWRAFGGRCDDGRQKCGISTSSSGK